MRSLIPLLVIWSASVTAEEFAVRLGRHGLHLTSDDALARAAEEVLPVWEVGDPHDLRCRMLLRKTIAFAPHGDPVRVATAAGLVNLRPGAVPGCWLADARTPAQSPRAAEILLRARLVRWAEPELSQPRSQRALPDDPLLAHQWHLINDGSQGIGASAGNDLHVSGAWTAGYTGTGRLIAIIDTGFDQLHPDLAAVYRSDWALNIKDHNTSPWVPTPLPPENEHGTICAGLAAARGNNGLGITGVAYDAQILPIDLLNASNSDTNDATALTHHLADLDVSSNSWGPSDTGVVTGRPGSQTDAALQMAITTGRGGLGTVITWASGNGRDLDDNLGYDGFASDYRVLAIGALNIQGEQAYYSEGGPALFAVAPGGDGHGGMVSTTPFSQYTAVADRESGTSFATPCVAGVAALVVQANPTLTWRDVRRVLATTATHIDATNPDWQTTAQGHPWHPGYGFGRIDAGSAVAAALTATLLPPSASPVTGSWTGSLGIPDGVGPTGDAASVAFTINAADTYRVEFVECEVNPIHPSQNNLEYVLTAPSGRTAVVERRTFNTKSASQFQWSACGFLDESPNGVWTLAVRDRVQGNTGRITSVNLTIRGYRTDGATASGQDANLTGTGGSPSGPSAPPDPLSQPSSSSTSGSGGHGCGQGSLLGLFFAGAALARFRRKV